MSEIQSQTDEVALHQRIAILEQENAALRAELSTSWDIRSPVLRGKPITTTATATAATQSATDHLTDSNSQRYDDDVQRSYMLLSTVAEVTKDLLENPDVEEAIAQALKRLGEAGDLSRVILMQEWPAADGDRLTHHVIQEWTLPSIPKQGEDPNTKVLNNDEYGILVNELHQGRSAWHILDGFPEPARTHQAELGVKSTGAVPIFIEGKYFGCVAFDDCVTYRQWKPYEIDVFTSGAGAIGAALHRKHLIDRLVEERLQSEQQRVVELAKANDALKRSLNVLATLADKTETVEVDKFIRHFLQVAAEQFDAPLVEYWQHSRQDHTAHLVLTYWEGQILTPAAQPGHPGNIPFPMFPSFIHRQTVGDRQPHFLIKDVTIDPHIRQASRQIGIDTAAWFQKRGVSCLLNIPLWINEKTIGALDIWLPGDRNFSKAQIEVGYALAQQMTLAIYLKTLAEQANQTALAKLNEVIAREQEKVAQDQARRLARANEALRGSLDRLAGDANLDTFLHHLLREVAAQLDARGAALFLYDAAAHTLAMEFTASDGPVSTPDTQPEELANFTQPVPADITPYWQTLIETRHPFIMDANNPEQAHLFWPGTREWHLRWNQPISLGVPMLLGQDALGFLGLSFEGDVDLNPEQLALAQALTHQATLALRLMRLAEETKQSAILDERNRMARDVHDTLAQAFTGIIMQLEATKRKIGSAQLPVAQDHVARARQLAQAGLSEARRSVHALRPETLESNDLPDALQALAQQMTCDTSARICVEIHGTAYPLAIHIENNLLRIAQEALTNALRHGEPQTVCLRLHFAPTAIHLHIDDDGQGFDPQSRLGSGFGIVSMQERSQRLGGEFNLTSHIGRGTEIVVSVPITPASTV